MTADIVNACTGFVLLCVALSIACTFASWLESGHGKP